MKNLICISKVVSFFIGMICFLLGVSSVFLSCKDSLEVQQKYDFEISTLPVPKSVKFEEMVEIRCEIIREKSFKDTEFYIRYFQPDGNGILQLDDGTIFLPNDLYLLPHDIFRLYYTSQCTEQQKIDLYFLDSFGQLKELSFTFTHNSKED